MIRPRFILIIPFILLFLACTCFGAKDPWVLKALKLQHQIDQFAPLNQAQFIGTHNSYNSKAYQRSFSYPDPNQILSIYNQLQLGIRSIELDVHWSWTENFKKDILLCHARKNHFGCSIYDRPIREALKEIKQWLIENPTEVVLIYIEQFLDGHGDELAAELKTYLDPFIYKPNSPVCASLPIQTTKAEIIDAGKQVILVTKTCPNDSTELNTYVFSGVGTIPAHPYTFLDDTITNFRPTPDCSRTNIFADDSDHHSMWRVFEDRTKLAKIIRPEREMTPADIQELTRCDINWPAMDMITGSDDRLNAAIWSWAPYYPQNEKQNRCAIYEYGVGFKNQDCHQRHPAYLCQENTTGSFHLVVRSGVWEEGETYCQTFSKEIRWNFTLPINGMQLVKIKTAMEKENIKTVWINYKYDHQWQPYALTRHRRTNG